MHLPDPGRRPEHDLDDLPELLDQRGAAGSARNGLSGVSVVSIGWKVLRYGQALLQDDLGRRPG